LLEKHGIDLLLQGCDHSEELLLSGRGNRCWGLFPLLLLLMS